MTRKDLTNNKPARLSETNHDDRTVTMMRSKRNLAVSRWRGSKCLGLRDAATQSAKWMSTE